MAEQFEGIEVIERDNAPPTLIVKFAVFSRWQEIDNAMEGHFLERILPGAFKKTIRENAQNVKVLLSHGKDPSLGQTVLGKIESMREEGDFAVGTVSLFRSLPALLLDGLRAGVYGASFRGDPVKNQVEWRPERSDDNPERLPEVSRQELRLKDIGPTPFGQYAEASAVLRSDTIDELTAASLLQRHEITRMTVLGEHGAAALDRQEPDPEATPDEEATPPDEDEPQHSAEETVHAEREEEASPSWQL